MNIDDYRSAKKNGLEERYRDDEISHRITSEVSLSEQIAILADRDTKPEKFKRYQELRAQKIQEVDAEIAEFKI